jgi:hypothetical protein
MSGKGGEEKIVTYFTKEEAQLQVNFCMTGEPTRTWTYEVREIPETDLVYQGREQAVNSVPVKCGLCGHGPKTTTCGENGYFSGLCEECERCKARGDHWDGCKWIKEEWIEKPMEIVPRPLSESFIRAVEQNYTGDPIFIFILRNPNATWWDKIKFRWRYFWSNEV